MYSLKRLVWLAFLIVGVMLGGIVVLGAYQWKLTSQYTDIIDLNERALFHFMTIRETITEALIEGQFEPSNRVIKDIEMLNSELTHLKENKVVSPELKFALADKIDLAGLAILLRQVKGDPGQIEKRKLLQKRLRTISDYLIQYDRIIAGQARARIVNFQKVVIGALGLIISLTSFSLILLYQNTVSPLLKLSKYLQTEDELPTVFELGTPAVKEVADLASSIELLAEKAVLAQENLPDSNGSKNLLADAINETTNQLNGIINYAQLLHDSTDSDEEDDERALMLQKIIENGVNIAGEWQKLK